MKNFLTFKEIVPIFLIIFSGVVGFLIFPLLPEQVPSHWDAMGVIDAWMSKDFAVLFFPILILVIYLALTLIPFVDPYKKNYLKFAYHYFWFRTAMTVFFIMIYFFSLWAAVGEGINMVYFIIPLLAVFISYTGFFLIHVKRNYFVGIRTPWTLHSEKIWDKTHEVGGKTMVIASMVSLLSLLNIQYAFIVFICIISIAAVIPCAYSYALFKKEKKK